MIAKKIIYTMSENKLILSNVLYAEGIPVGSPIMLNFCGEIITTLSELKNLTSVHIVYLTGDLKNQIFVGLDCQLYIIKDFSTNYETTLRTSSNVGLIEQGQVPLNVHNVGVFFPKFFGNEAFFEKIQAEHEFQNLTESTKDSFALRKGIYLTNVERNKNNGELLFHLLRCSSNLCGPTDNFRETDKTVVNMVNEMLPKFFNQQVQVNHVLAQIYYNVKKEDSAKEKKASIKAHSDKTKDMPPNGVIAFATFYDSSSIVDKEHLSAKNNYDVVYKGKKSIFTEMEFVLKDPAANPTLEEKFRVTLYPNSLFVISLEMNRLYTHEIKPSCLQIDALPTRMGYVMRCSMRKAVYSNGQTFIVEENGTRHVLEPMNPKDMKDIKDLYFDENSKSEKVSYRPIYTSLNNGDYTEPLI